MDFGPWIEPLFVVLGIGLVAYVLAHEPRRPPRPTVYQRGAPDARRDDWTA
jgi:hypothetical protein